MKHHKDMIGLRIRRLLQTRPKRGRVILKEFGEPFWIELVIELEDGRLISVQEYGCEEFRGKPRSLQTAELVQDQYSLADVEGHIVVDVLDTDADFGLILDNGLHLHCPAAPGGNYPWLFTKDELEEPGDV